MQQSTSGGGDKGNLEKIGEGIGGLMGQAADTMMGVFGTMMNNMGGWWSEHAPRPGRSGGFGASFSTDREGECRRHFQAQAGTGRSFDEARPLYQFGHMAGQNPDYQGRSFDQIEMDLERAWGPEQQKRYGSWPDVRGYVRFGYGGPAGSASGGSGAGGFQASGGYDASGGRGADGGFRAEGR